MNYFAAKIFLGISIVVLGIGLLLSHRGFFAEALALNTSKIPSESKTVAPDFVGGPWINTPDGKAINLLERKGKVTVVEFWTFGCSNCRANLPAYANWHKQFAAQDVAVIGIHTPETEGERVQANVERQVKQLGINYPILIDQNYANWDRWHVEAWPTTFLVDKQGQIRYRWIGELNYGNADGEAKLTRLIMQLLKEPSK